MLWLGHVGYLLLALREDDFAAGGPFVELADRDDVLHLRDQVVLLEPEEVNGSLAGIDPGSRVVDHLDELRYRGDVEFAHLPFHVVGDQRRHSRQPSRPRGEMQPGVTYRR